MSDLVLGEYWIKPNGDVDYADGDAGEFNHDDRVIEWAQCEILCQLAMDTDQEFDEDFVLECVKDEFNKMTFKAYIESLTDDERQGHSDTWWNDVYSIATIQHSCPKDWALENLGWIWVRRTHIGCYEYTSETRKHIRRGLEEILDQEGLGDETDEMEFTIQFCSGRNTTVYATLRDLQEENQPQRGPLIAEKSAQLEALDRAAMSETYKGKMGD